MALDLLDSVGDSEVHYEQMKHEQADIDRLWAETQALFAELKAA
jgi:hypothetical protein